MAPFSSIRQGRAAVALALVLFATMPGDAGAQPDGAIEIDVEGFAFPPEVVVEAGGTVRWSNADPAPHTVTASAGAFDSGQIPTGGSFERVFPEPGTFAYACLIHPSMTGTVTVTTVDGGGVPSASPAPPSAATGEATVLERTTIFDTDPLGIGGPALTLLAPRGWLVEGGPAWRHEYANLVSYAGRVVSPDRSRAVEYFPLYPQTWQEGGIPFFPRGSNYLGHEVRPPIRDAAAFIETLILPAYRADVGARVIDREPLPDVADAFARMSLPGTEVVAERVLTEHFFGEQRMLEEFNVVLTYTPNPFLPGAVSWGPQQLFSVRAPADELDDVRPMLQAVAQSPVMDPTWGAWYEYVLGLSIQNGLGAIRAAGAASDLISQTNAEITDMLIEGYEQRQAVNDAVHEAMTQTILGLEVYEDPFSDDVFELPNGYTYAYASDTGSVILSNDPAFDPVKAFPEEYWEAMTISR